MNTATASGCLAMVSSSASTSMPSATPITGCTLGLMYTGTAPQRISALMTLLWTFRGKMILSPALQAERTMACTALVVPPTIKKAWAAPKASAVSRSAWAMTETGLQRLSRGFMLLTSSPTQRSPNSCVSSGLPRPRLWPGTSKGTTRRLRNRSSASQMGAFCCKVKFMGCPPAKKSKSRWYILPSALRIASKPAGGRKDPQGMDFQSASAKSLACCSY